MRARRHLGGHLRECGMGAQAAVGVSQCDAQGSSRHVLLLNQAFSDDPVPPYPLRHHLDKREQMLQSHALISIPADGTFGQAVEKMVVSKAHEARVRGMLSVSS